MIENKEYNRLVKFASETKDRFAFIIVRSSHFDIQYHWMEELTRDLQKKEIHILHIRGNDWETHTENTISSLIQKHQPSTGRYIVCLSRFDYYMMPQYSAAQDVPETLSPTNQVAPSPPHFLQRLNVERDTLIKKINAPIIFWASPAAVRQVAEFAPDFFDFRQTIIDLPQLDNNNIHKNIKRTSFIKRETSETLFYDTWESLKAEFNSLKSQIRNQNEGRRYIYVAKKLAVYEEKLGTDRRTLEFLDLGLEEAQRLGFEEEVARINIEIASNFQRTDKSERVQNFINIAISIFQELARKEFDLYAPELILNLNRKAIFLAETAYPYDAQKVFEKAIKLARKIYKREPEVHSVFLGEILNNYACVLDQIGNQSESESLYKEAIGIFRSIGNDKYRHLLAQILFNYGNLLAKLNMLDKALPLHQEALHLLRLGTVENKGKNNEELMQSLFNLSYLNWLMKNDEEAERLYEEYNSYRSTLSQKLPQLTHQIPQINLRIPPIVAMANDNIQMHDFSTKNPYKFRRRIHSDSPIFFGRKEEMKRLEDMLSEDYPASVSIIGEWRAGKSSLAFRVYHQLKQMPDTLAIYLDCDEFTITCQSAGAFYELLSSGFKEILNNNADLDLPRNEIGFDTYRGFRDFVREVSGEGFRIIVFLDEFEHLPGKKFADDSFFSNLRALGDNPEYSFAFVTISRTPIKELTHKAIKSSSFYNIFNNLYIGLLDHESIKALRNIGFKKAPFVLSKKEIKKISYYAGDFAFFNQLVCSFLWDAKKNNVECDWVELEMALYAHYLVLWDNRSSEEQIFLKEVNKNKSSQSPFIRSFLATGILIKKENRYDVFSEFFRELINNKFEIKKPNFIKELKRAINLAASGYKILFEDIQKQGTNTNKVFKKIHNPYIAGPALAIESPLFIGRDDIYQFIDKNITPDTQHHTIVFHGLRRTGKSSLLYRLEKQGFSNTNLVPVNIDLQGIDDELDFYYTLSNRIIKRLDLSSLSPVDNFGQFKRFIDGLSTTSDGKIPVIMLDEFEELQMRVEDNRISRTVFSNLRHLMQHEEKIIFIFCGTHKIEELTADYWSIFFNTALYRRIGSLHRNDAVRLITEPVKNQLDYDDLAIDHILHMSGHQPYLIQLICRTIVNDLNEKKKRNDALVNDVDEAVEKIILQDNDNFSKEAWKGSNYLERMILSATAQELTHQKREHLNLEDILDTIEPHIRQFSRETAIDTIDSLTTREILTEKNLNYHFTIDMMRQWIANRHPLRKVRK